MKNKIGKVAVLGTVGIVAALAIRSISSNESINLKKSKEKILSKKDDIKSLKRAKNVCGEDFSDKVQNKFEKLKGSLFNKQSSTSVVFGNPVYNVYSKEGGSEDGQE